MELTIKSVEIASRGPNESERPIATCIIHSDDRSAQVSVMIEMDSLDVAFLMNRLVEVMQVLSKSAAGDLPT